MAETANNVAQRYAVLEQAYSKEDWATVLRDGEELLGELRQANDPRMLGLQMRLQLLLGHTQLYGFGDKAAAAGFYGAVATQSAEAALANIAEQGLKQCGEVEPQAPAAASPQTPFAGPAPDLLTTPAVLTFDAGGSPPPGGGTTTPATPWLAAAAPSTAASTPAPTTDALEVDEPPAPAAAAPWIEAALIPEVVEEPELIEVHQADPSLAEDVELTWNEPAPSPQEATQSAADERLPDEDEELLSGLMLVRLG